MALAMMLALALQSAAPAAANDCQAAIGDIYDGPEIASLANQVDGSSVNGVAGLTRLRAERKGPIVVKGGNFAGADFRNARLSNICFVETDLSRSDWSDADAPGSAFVDADLEGAKLNRARLTRILLRQANLKDVKAVEADLSGGKLDGGWNGSVENFDLHGARLIGFRFQCGITVGDGCPLGGDMRLRNADLTDASLAGFFRISDWSSARLDRTELSLAHLAQSHSAFPAGPVRVRGGDTVVELSPEEYRALMPLVTFTPAVDPMASFDCAAARNPAEKAICSADNDQLRISDLELADLYQLARASDTSLTGDQQAWLRRRDACGADAECLAARYEERKGQLIGRLGPPAWARPGAFALFVQPELQFSASGKDHPLYRRLLPALIDGAFARVVVRVNRDGSIDAGGDAVGGNAHLCSLAGERLTFDRANGWYSGAYEDDEETPAALRGRPMPVLRFIGERAQVYRGGQGGYDGTPDPRASNYASCGVRASFGELVRVPVTQAEAEALLRSYAEER
jgi:uncharacterized protein YjbI with pentapeptide repeats